MENWHAMRKEVLRRFGPLSPEDLAEECLKVYNLMDENGDGISFDEFQKGAFVAWGVRFSTRRAYKIFQKYDVDGGGHISVEEFSKIVQELLKMSEEEEKLQAKVMASYVVLSDSPWLITTSLCFCVQSSVTYAPLPRLAGA